MYSKKIYVFLALYKNRNTIYTLLLYKARENCIYCNCIIRNCIIRWPFSLQYLHKIYICLQSNWSKIFVNCIIKCITRGYTFLHVYIQFSLALYKTETELYTSVYKVREASRERVASEFFWREATDKLCLTFAMEHN